MGHLEKLGPCYNKDWNTLAHYWAIEAGLTRLYGIAIKTNPWAAFRNKP